LRLGESGLTEKDAIIREYRTALVMAKKTIKKEIADLERILAGRKATLRMVSAAIKSHRKEHG
jgi:hypothetical protein